MQFLADGGDVFEDENAVEPIQEEEIQLPIIKMSEGLKAMNGMKIMCVEKWHTNLFRLLASTFAETERIILSDSHKKQKVITEYFAKN